MKGIDLVLHEPMVQEVMSSWTVMDIEATPENIYSVVEKNHLAGGTAVVWMEQKIAIVSTEQELYRLLQENEAYWFELRAFTTEGELYLQHVGAKAKGRLRIDGAEEGSSRQEYVDTAARLWGKSYADAQSAEHIVLADKERKISIELPFQQEAAQYYGLVTRNYVGMNPVTYQAGYVDYRFVEFCPADIKEV